MAQELGREPDIDYATRMGELAMTFNSVGGLTPIAVFSHVANVHLSLVVAVLAGTLLPRLTNRDTRLLAHGEEDDDAEFARLKATVREWRAEAARQGGPLKLPFMPFFLRNIWTGAMLLFATLMLGTFFVTKVWQVSYCLSLMPKDLGSKSVGCHRSQSRRYLLGRRLLDSVRNYHGGMRRRPHRS